jgi:hypothetical protein
MNTTTLYETLVKNNYLSEGENLKSPETFFTTAIYHQLDKIIAEFKLMKYLSHSGEKGREAEGILRNFLKTIIPGKFDIGTGFAVNDAATSNQVDILVYDKYSVPPIYSGYELIIQPVHSLAMVIESKMSLNSSQIEKCQSDAQIIKTLFDANFDYIYLQDQEREYTGPLTVLFAFESTLSINTIADKLNQSKNKGIDIVCVLNQGICIYYPEHESYSIIDASSHKFFGVTPEGYHITLHHKYFAQFISIILDRLNSFKAVKPNYTRWYMNSSIFTDFVIE